GVFDEVVAEAEVQNVALAVVFFPNVFAGLRAVVWFAAKHLGDGVADEDEGRLVFASELGNGGVALRPVVDGPIAVLGARDEAGGLRRCAGNGLELELGEHAHLLAVFAEGAGFDGAASGEEDRGEIWAGLGAGVGAVEAVADDGALSRGFHGEGSVSGAL